MQDYKIDFSKFLMKDSWKVWNREKACCVCKHKSIYSPQIEYCGKSENTSDQDLETFTIKKQLTQVLNMPGSQNYSNLQNIHLTYVNESNYNPYLRVRSHWPG